jgi:hypothetical protein
MNGELKTILAGGVIIFLAIGAAAWILSKANGSDND